MVSDSERLEEIRLQNKARAQRYYDTNKLAVSERRKAKRAEINRLLQEAVPKPSLEEEKAEALKQTSLSEMIQRIDLNESIGEGSKKTYKTAAKTLYRLLNITDFNTAFIDSEDVIHKIDTAVTVTGKKPYSTNSKKQLYQLILKLVYDILKLTLPEKALYNYNQKFKVVTVQSQMEAEEKQETEQVLDYSKYLDMVKDKFTEVSQEYIIASLYYLAGFRDNLQLVLISKETPESTADLTRNYLSVNLKNKRIGCIMILNRYKTDKQYGTDRITIPNALSAIIKKYIEVNNLKYGDYLLGDKKLSATITAFNKKLNLNIGINQLRQMRVSDKSKHADTAEKRVQLANEMKHAPQTTSRYKRTILQID
jgi:hypothetical protein